MNPTRDDNPPPEVPPAPVLSPADLGMTAKEMRRAVSLDLFGYFPICARHLIKFRNRLWVVLGWERPERLPQRFTLFSAVPLAMWSAGPFETFGERRKRLRRQLRPGDHHGLVFAGPDGAEYVVDQSEKLIVEAPFYPNTHATNNTTVTNAAKPQRTEQIR